MIALADVQRTDQTPYVSSGGYSMPSIGSTFDAPAAPSAPAPAPSFPTVGGVLSGGGASIANFFKPPATASDVRPSFPTVGEVLSGGGGSIANYFNPPATASDASPSIPGITPSMPGASGTPSGTPASGGDTSVPAVGQDYFHDVLDLITAQLTTGQPSTSQQFSATPVALPSGGSYDGATADAGSAGGLASAHWPGILVIALIGGGLYYWFVYRKKHGGAA